MLRIAHVSRLVDFFFKVWWQLPLFLFIFFLHTFIITFIRYVHSYSFAEVSLLFLHCFFAQREKPPWGAEPGFELEPAVQQASALPTKPRSHFFSGFSANKGG